MRQYFGSKRRRFAEASANMLAGEAEGRVADQGHAKLVSQLRLCVRRWWVGSLLLRGATPLHFILPSTAEHPVPLSFEGNAIMKKILISALAGVSALAASAPAFAAGSNPGTLDVKLTVTTGCDINGNGGIGAGTGANSLIDFGSYAPGDTVAAADTGSSLVITCSGTQTPSLEFDAGQNPVGTQRMLKQVSGTGTIAYNLGSTSGGNEYGTNTGVALAAFTAGQAREVKVYGSLTGAIPAGAEGAYSDAVTVSLTW